MTLTIYFVRHAEAANQRGVLYGRLPRINLSAKGRQQAAELASAMADLPLEVIYYSPLLRARRTASILAARHPGIPLVRSSLLLENRHPYEGRPQKEVAALADRAYDLDVLGAEGESIADLRQRLTRFVHQAERRHPGGVLAAVGHADPLAALRVHLLGKELSVATLRHEAPPLAAVFRVDLEGDKPARLEWFYKPAPAAQDEPGASTKEGLNAGLEHEHSE